MTMNASESNPYDQIPYESYAYASSHPSRLAVIGRLFGLPSTPPERCQALDAVLKALARSALLQETGAG